MGDFLSTTLRGVSALLFCLFSNQHAMPSQTLINISSAFLVPFFSVCTFLSTRNGHGARTATFIIPARVCSGTRFTSRCAVFLSQIKVIYINASALALSITDSM